MGLANLISLSANGPCANGLLCVSSNLLAPLHEQAACPGTTASADDPHGLQASFPGRF